MKTSRIVIGFALLAFASFTSCKKNYTCTCTTVVGAASSDVRHDINKANYADAKLSCINYEEQANASLPGGTTCRL